MSSRLINRFIHEDDTTLKDLSIELNNPLSRTGAMPFVAADDYFYVGGQLPFGALFFKMGTANATASDITVEHWDGSAWKAAVDVLDDTATGGASLGQDGYLTYKVDKSGGGWVSQDTNNMTSSGLQTLKIFDLYWLRLSFSADLDAGTTIQYVGHKFCSDEDVGSQYAQLNTTNIKSQFQTGKTDWDDQTIEASEMMIRDLAELKYIVTRHQVLDPDQLRHACVYRTAAIIFNEFGDDYDDEYERALQLYRDALRDIIRVDKNANGRLDVSEWIGDSSVVRR